MLFHQDDSNGNTASFDAKSEVAGDAYAFDATTQDESVELGTAQAIDALIPAMRLERKAWRTCHPLSSYEERGRAERLAQELRLGKERTLQT